MDANIVPLNQALKAIATTSQSPALTTDETGIYHINGGSDLLGKINNVIDFLENVELTEDDRDMVRETRRFTNEFIKAVDRSVIDERARVFDQVNEERKAINERMTVMKRILADKLDQFDQRIRAEKRAELQAHFEDEKTMGEYSHVLAKISFEMIENQSWFNRSASVPKARQELSERVKSLATAVMLSEDGEEVANVVSILVEAEWSLPDVIVEIQKKKQQREEAEHEKQRRTREIEEAERRGREQALAEIAESTNHPDKASAEVQPAEGGQEESREQTIAIRFTGTTDQASDVRNILIQALNEHGYGVADGQNGGEMSVTIG